MNKRWFATLVLALAFPAIAQQQDPPARVGRVAWMQGEVSVYADPERDWEKAYVNSPLTSENSLWTEPEARVELRVGASALRLDGATQLDMRQLDDDLLRAHVPRGLLAVSVRHFESGEQFSVSTPHGRLLVRTNGRYRIESDPDRGESLFTVLAGDAQLEVEGRRVDVNRGDAVRVNDRGQFDFERAATTEFDDWALARDNRVVATQSERYVSPRMTGYEDLDAYGNWNVEPDYGPVWYPSRVGADYVPYRNGHWAHVRPWGWTWVDHAPWGYAPFHYGRWVYVGNRWGWHPGRYVARPVWAPALVGWVGRPGWNISVSSGSAPAIGWYPLAPWDRYQPWYRANTRYVNNVNVVVINRPPRYREGDGNRDRGSTVTTRENFVSQRPIVGGIAQGQVPGAVIAAQPVVSGMSVLPSVTEARAARPLVNATPGGSRPSVSGQPAPGSAPVPRTNVLTPTAPAYRPPVQGQPAPTTQPLAPQPQTKPLRAPTVSGQPAPAPAPAPVPQGRQNLQPAPQASPQQSAPVPQQAPLARPKPAPQQQPAQPVVREQPVIRQQVPVQSGRVVTPAPAPAPQGAPAPQPAPQAKPVPKPQALEKPEAEQKPEQKPEQRPGRQGLVK